MDNISVKLFPLSNGNKKTLELEDKDFWDELYAKRAAWLAANGFSEGLRTYDFMDGPFESLMTGCLDYHPDSTVRDPFDYVNYTFRDYANKIMQYQRRFYYLGTTGELEPILLRDHGFDSSEFTFEVKIDFSNEFDIIRKSIKDQCQQMIEAAKEHKSVQWSYAVYPSDYLRDKNGKTIPHERLFSLWEKGIEIYLQYKKCGNKSQVSRDMGLFNDESRGSSVNLISKHLEHTERLIAAALSRTFLQEAANPFTAGKVRKERQRKRIK